jgi:hypothetical protein
MRCVSVLERGAVVPFPALFSRFTHASRAIARLRNALLRALRSPIFPIARRPRRTIFSVGRAHSDVVICAHFGTSESYRPKLLRTAPNSRPARLCAVCNR